MRRSIVPISKRLNFLEKVYLETSPSHGYSFSSFSRDVSLHNIKPNDAVSLFTEMINTRPLPSIAKMKKHDLVISLIEEMQKLGITRDLYSYSILLNSLCRCSKLSLALATLGKMMKLGYKPSIVTLNSLINGYCRENMISGAISLVDQMVESGYKPNVVTFKTLLHWLLLEDRVYEAVGFVDRMVRKGCEVDVVCYGVVINGVCKRGDVDLALSLLTIRSRE